MTKKWVAGSRFCKVPRCAGLVETRRELRIEGFLKEFFLSL